MPIAIRTLHPNFSFSAASYRFPAAQDKSVVEDWPWLRLPAPNTSLCDTCSRLNFHWLFRESLAGFEVPYDMGKAQLSDGLCLGLYADVACRSDCLFCQLLVYSLEEGGNIDMLNDYENWAHQEIWLRNHALTESGRMANFEALNNNLVVRLDIRLKADAEENVLFSSGVRTLTIQEIRESREQCLVQGRSGRALDRTTEGLVQTVQRWLRPCVNDNDSTALPPQHAESASIRLIDTTNACIVGHMRHERYVALRYFTPNYVLSKLMLGLSYTWGKIDPLVLLKSNEAELRENGALITYETRLPRTIRDSICLCKMLGERYLWVDSLCIMQDTTDKHDQIQQMDMIYQGAVLCIVAAAGRDANAGLPGVSGERDMRQRIIEVDGMKLANTLPDLVTSVAATFWRSRGWCFQENLLSLRKLVFTPDQTYFHCPHGECNEDSHCFNHDRLAPATDHSSLGLNLDNVSNWRVYKNLVAEYSSCELSFEADMLNAFSGIASFLSKSVFRGCPLVMGIPLCSIEVALLWQPSGRLRRRIGAGLPSWSWVGWVGMINYADENENIFERTISHIQWNLGENSDGPPELMTCVPSQAWKGWKDWTRVIVGELNEVHYTHVELPSTRWFSHPIPKQQWPIQPTTSLLVCTAEVAKLVVTGEHTDSWYQECTEDEHDVCHLKVFDCNGHHAGVIVMDGATFEATVNSQTSYSFVKVSQTTLTARDDPAWDEGSKSYAGKPGEPAINPRQPLDAEEEEFDQSVYDCNVCWCMYNVLIVEFDGDIARRIAVGRVQISAFDNASPERRSFRLG